MSTCWRTTSCGIVAPAVNRCQLWQSLLPHELRLRRSRSPARRSRRRSAGWGCGGSRCCVLRNASSYHWCPKARRTSRRIRRALMKAGRPARSPTLPALRVGCRRSRRPGRVPSRCRLTQLPGSWPTAPWRRPTARSSRAATALSLASWRSTTPCGARASAWCVTRTLSLRSRCSSLPTACRCACTTRFSRTTRRTTARSSGSSWE
mmetsp:Transcript_4334/g.12516  ORF Transcript_4334/g.12516 Transcript_4334/m.12516 type:complete len:206 (-) Transcript_4334:3062-3679(-)